MNRRRELAKQLKLLTPSQINMFRLCFGTTEAVKVSKRDLKNAVRICAATIEDNRSRILDVIAERMDDE